MVDLGEIFERVKKGELITTAEMINFLIILIRSNTAFQLVFEPKTQTVFATLELTITINPKLSTAVTITLTDEHK